MKIYLYNSLLETSKNNIYEIVNNIDDCDYVFFSCRIKSKQTGIKYVDENHEIIKDVYKLVCNHNKKLIYFCGGDRPPIILPNKENVIVLNTSVNKSTKPFNEKVVGVVVEDKFSHFINEPKLNIGFVGQKCCGRDKYLKYLENIDNIETNFILRDKYIHKLKEYHIKEFENNMNNNLFTFCYRGAGNFSVRFYETLMRGRIPIVVKTDSIFPFENLINYENIGIFIEENELNDKNTLKDLILNYYNNKTKDELLNIQKNNREIYLKYFHKDNYFDNIFENIII